MTSRAERKTRQQQKKKARQRYDKQLVRNKLAQPGPNNFIMVLDNLKSGVNVPKIFRTAEIMGAQEIHLINIGWFDPAPAKGAFRKVPAIFHDTFVDCYQQLCQQGYTLYKLSPDCETSSFNCTLENKSAFIMGHEEVGHSFAQQDFPDIRCLTIPHYGITESLNVSIAASIIMYEYIRQHAGQDYD